MDDIVRPLSRTIGLVGDSPGVGRLTNGEGRGDKRDTFAVSGGLVREEVDRFEIALGRVGGVRGVGMDGRARGLLEIGVVGTNVDPDPRSSSCIVSTLFPDSVAASSSLPSSFSTIIK